MLYDDAEFVPLATLAHDTLCATLSGLSKIYRACGYRVGWASFSGRVRPAADYLSALELLSSLRLCAAVPAQWAVADGARRLSEHSELVRPGGRLYESRAAIPRGDSGEPLSAVESASRAMYAFVATDTRELPGFDDRLSRSIFLSRNSAHRAGVSFTSPIARIFVSRTCRSGRAAPGLCPHGGAFEHGTPKARGPMAAATSSMRQSRFK